LPAQLLLIRISKVFFYAFAKGIDAAANGLAVVGGEEFFGVVA
jgi:hypothetical protein